MNIETAIWIYVLTNLTYIVFAVYRDYKNMKLKDQMDFLAREKIQWMDLLKRSQNDADEFYRQWNIERAKTHPKERE